MKFICITKRHLSKIRSAFLQIFSGEPWNDVWEDGQLKQYLCELAGNKNSLSFGLFDKNGLIAISLGRIKHWCGTGVFRKISGRVICNENAVVGSDFLRLARRKTTICRTDEERLLYLKIKRFKSGFCFAFSAGACGGKNGEIHKKTRIYRAFFVRKNRNAKKFFFPRERLTNLGKASIIDEVRTGRNVRVRKKNPEEKA